MKEVVLEFIHQIEQADFSKGSDVKMLYERAKEIESQLINVTYSGNPSNVSRLLDVTEKMKRAPEVRIIRINPFKAFSSGLDTIDNVMGNFQQWQEEHNHLVKKLMYGVRVDSVHQLHKNKDTINSCPYFYAESRLSVRIGVFSMQKRKGRKLNNGTYLSKLQK